MGHPSIGFRSLPISNVVFVKLNMPRFKTLHRILSRGVTEKQAEGWAETGRDVYLFVINGAKERAPAAAQALRRRLER